MIYPSVIAIAALIAIVAFACLRPRWGGHHRSPRFGPPKGSKFDYTRKPTDNSPAPSDEDVEAANDEYEQPL